MPIDPMSRTGHYGKYAKDHIGEVEEVTIELKDSMIETGRATEDTLKAMAGFGAIASVIGQLAAAINRVTDSIVRGFAEASNAAIDYIEDAERITNIFDKQGDAAARLGEKVSAAYGLARDEGAKVLANTSDLLIGFGFTEKQALKLSESIIKLGGDLASFRNMADGVVGTTESLSSGILGDRENLKRLGAIVRMTDDDYKAAEERFRSFYGFSEKQAEILATLQLSYDQNRKALGDFARTLPQAANQMRIFNSAIRDFKLEIGLAVVQGFALNKILMSMTAIVKSSLKWWSETSKEFKVAAIAVTAIAVAVLAATSAILALAAVLSVVVIAVAAMGSGGILFVAVVAGIIAAVVQAALAFAALVAILGEGDTLTERFASGIGVLGTILQAAAGFLVNFSQNLAIWQQNVGILFAHAADQIIGYWDIISNVISDGVANALIEMGNMVKMFENLPRAIAVAMTFGSEAGKIELVRGMDDTIDTVGNAAARMAKLRKKDLEFNKFKTTFSLGDIPILAGLEEILKGMTGGGGGPAEFKSPGAVVEGSVAASDLIASMQSTSANPEERAAAAAETTAAAANVIAGFVSEIAGDGVNLKNAQPA